MQQLKKLTILAAFSTLLVGCATGLTPYQAANSDSSLGYSETKVESDRFRVSYTANTSDEAFDLALLRAAEIAKAENYSHFLVVGAGQDVMGSQSSVTPRIGIGLGTGGYRSRVGGSIGIGIPIGGNTKKTRQSLEIKLLQAASSEPNVYAADEVLRNLSQP